MDFEIDIPIEARQRYFERRQKDLETLSSALNAGHFEEFKRIGHQLKGNAASFGYPQLEKIAIELERAGKEEDSIGAAHQLELLARWLKETSI